MLTSSLPGAGAGWFGPVAVTGAPPLPRGGHTATFIDNKLFVFGGNAYRHAAATAQKDTNSNLTTVVQDDLHVFDILTCTWIRIAPKGTHEIVQHTISSHLHLHTHTHTPTPRIHSRTIEHAHTHTHRTCNRQQQLAISTVRSQRNCCWEKAGNLWRIQWQNLSSRYPHT